MHIFKETSGYESALVGGGGGGGGPLLTSFS